jgi:hypothetical protein
MDPVGNPGGSSANSESLLRRRPPYLMPGQACSAILEKGNSGAGTAVDEGRFALSAAWLQLISATVLPDKTGLMRWD